MSTSYNLESNESSYKSSVRDENGVISAGSGEDEEYGDVSHVKKIDESGYGDADNEQEQEEISKVNSLCADLSCLCIPTLATKEEMTERVGKWFLGNSDQFISSIIGE
jgi:hypothetical protein